MGKERTNKSFNSKRKGLSLEKFAKAKRYDGSYSRELKKKEFLRKAGIMREYKRVLRREGYQDDGKALGSQTSSTDEIDEKVKEGPEIVQELKPEICPKKTRMQSTQEENVSRFQRAKDESKRREEERLAKLKAVEERKANKLKREQERQNWSKKLRKKNQWGQPVLRHQIDHLLTKLEKEPSPHNG